jgi:hypothetical protein
VKDELREARKQAEQAVVDMPEGELKLRAFETILSHLLSTLGGSNTQDSVANKKPRPIPEVGSPRVPTSLTERILSLKSKTFFASQRSIAEVRQELKKHGWHYPVTSLSGALQSLVQKGALRREMVADGMGKKVWKYSNP